MKVYPRETIKTAIELIEEYPEVFSTSVTENVRALEPLLDAKLGTKQAREKMVYTLARTIALLMEGKRKKALRIKGKRTLIRKKTKHKIKRYLKSCYR